MLVWRAGRSSWTRTEVGGLTAVEHSPAKTSPKWTVLRPTPPAGWPSLWSKPSCAGEFWSRWGRGAGRSRSVYINAYARGKKMRLSATCQCVTGVLRNRGRPPSVHLLVHLRLLGENRVGAASDCQQELRPEARRHRQVIFIYFFWLRWKLRNVHASVFLWMLHNRALAKHIFLFHIYHELKLFPWLWLAGPPVCMPLKQYFSTFFEPQHIFYVVKKYNSHRPKIFWYFI